MTNFEEFILNLIINNSKVNYDGTYEIDMERLIKLELDPRNVNIVKTILDDNKISVVDSKNGITEEEWNKNGDNFFKQPAELDEYLNRKFIPNSIQIKNVKSNRNSAEEIYASIHFDKLAQLPFSNQELRYVVKYLQDRDIIVTGVDSELDASLEDYDYLVAYKTKHLPRTMSWDAQKKLFEKYMETKNVDIKKRIVEANMVLVPFVTYKYAMKYNLDIDELNSCGYESLIMAVGEFDVSKNRKFSQFAYRAIRKGINEQLYEFLGFRDQETYNSCSRIYKCMDKLSVEYKRKPTANEVAAELNMSVEMIEKVLNDSVTENIDGLLERKAKLDEYRDDLADGYISEEFLDQMEGVDFVGEFEQADKQAEQIFETSSPEKDANNQLLHDSLEEILGTLTEKEADILRMRYGMHDGRTHSLEEVGQIYGVTRVKVLEKEKKAIRKLRHPSRAKKVRDFYC